MQIVFSDRAYKSIMAETLEMIDTETGGLFLGAFVDDCCYVVENIDPGIECIFEPAFFEYDKNYTQHLINKIAKIYDYKLELVGLWHRHPGSFDVFSAIDDITNERYASMRNEGAISILVNIDTDFRITPYHVTLPLSYTKIDYKVGDVYLPKNILKLKNEDDFLNKINGYYIDKQDTLSRLQIFMDEIMHELKKYEINFKPDIEMSKDCEVDVDELIDVFISDINFLSMDLGINVITKFDKKVIKIYQVNSDISINLYKLKDYNYIISYGDSLYSYKEGLLENLYKRCKKKKIRLKDILFNRKIK